MLIELSHTKQPKVFNMNELVVKRGRGKPAGTVSNDSMTDRLSKLEVGEYLLLPGYLSMSNLSNAVSRFNGMFIGSAFEIKTCNVFTSAMDEVPFKAYRIKRTA